MISDKNEETRLVSLQHYISMEDIFILKLSKH